MKKSQFLLLVFGLMLLAALILYLTAKKEANNQPLSPSVNSSINQPVSQPVDQTLSSTSSTEITNNPEVVINNPTAGEVVTSPLTVIGQAKGNWFFEASLPVKLVDDTGQVIAAVPGQAQSDWMTEAMVPFQADLVFTAPPTATSGYLIISKDNPSGLPQNDASVKIPVKFK